MDKYEDRCVVFLDMLGFSEFMEVIRKEPIMLHSLLTTFKMIDKHATHSLREPHDIQITSFSDCIVVSGKMSERGAIAVFLSTIFLCRDLLVRMILVRGGCASGCLFHRTNVVFGEGMLQAYNLERNVAKYPRVVVSDALVAMLHSYPHNTGVPDLVREDFDGVWHLNIFGDLRCIRDYYKQKLEPAKCLRKGLRAIKMPLTLACLQAVAHADPSVRMKAQWMIKYFNSALLRYEVKGVRAIKEQKPRIAQPGVVADRSRLQEGYRSMGRGEGKG